jgi:hypothetical protein
MRGDGQNQLQILAALFKRDLSNDTTILPNQSRWTVPLSNIYNYFRLFIWATRWGLVTEKP